MYVRMFVCVCVCVYLRTYVCMYTHLYVSVYVCTYLFMYKHTWIDTYIHFVCLLRYNNYVLYNGEEVVFSVKWELSVMCCLEERHSLNG